MAWLRADDHWFFVVCAIGIIWWLLHDVKRDLDVARDIRWWRKQRER